MTRSLNYPNQTQIRIMFCLHAYVLFRVLALSVHEFLWVIPYTILFLLPIFKLQIMRRKQLGAAVQAGELFRAGHFLSSFIRLSPSDTKY